jgi:hypothetical protein
MDFYAVCLAALMGLLSAHIVGLISVGFQTAMRAVFRKLTVSEFAVRHIEAAMAARVAPASVHNSGISIDPGWYVVFFTPAWRSVALVHKTANERNDDTVYEIFAPFAAGAAFVLAAVHAGLPRVTTTIELNQYALHNYVGVIPRRVARPGQREAVDQLTAAYARDRRASMLLHGPPGAGKTVAAEIFAIRLADERGIIPQVIKFNVARPGTAVHYVPTEKRPLIVVFDELNHILTTVEAKKDTSAEVLSFQCILGLLDYWNGQEHVVVIGTTNAEPDTFPPALLRAGRFDRVIALEGAG